MTVPSDPRAAVEYRVPAASLRKGDLVNTSPGEDDWQEVLAVYTDASHTDSAELRALVESLGGRYVVVELTDLAPVDSGVYFVDGVATLHLDTYAPTAPPTTSAANSNPKPNSRFEPSNAACLTMSAIVVRIAIAIPTMPNTLPARALLGLDNPLSA